MTKRSYRLQERARQQDATRQRIVEATAQLHAELGPAATTISAIAERAGVQRLTVYRHFPDEAELFGACAAYSQEQYPAPDPSLWAGIGDPVQRARTALAALYSYYAAGAQGLALVLRDAEQLPALRTALAAMGSYLEAIAADLASAWQPRPEAERGLHAAIGLALDFWAWRALAARQLTPHEAAHLMACLISAAARGCDP
ncbi:MAG: TetR/AcrR family transcriptional regulator [Gemmatimonadetes bacterium]|nr:TetR/AcrR family transcriptional regulator [Gemmatimonadota bacterium]